MRFSDRAMRCSNCGSENPVGKNFCGNCGTQLGNTCPKCGVENPPSNKFCGDCGAVLAADSRTTASSNQLPSPAPAMSGISIAAGPASGAIPDGERKTRHGAVRRHQGLDGADGGPRPGGGARDHRSGAEADDRRGPSLRRLHRAIHRRRHLRAVRRAGRA